MLIFIEIMDYIGAERKKRIHTRLNSHLLIPKFPLADNERFVDT